MGAIGLGTHLVIMPTVGNLLAPNIVIEQRHFGLVLGTLHSQLATLAGAFVDLVRCLGDVEHPCEVNSSDWAWYKVSFKL